MKKLLLTISIFAASMFALTATANICVQNATSAVFLATANAGEANWTKFWEWEGVTTSFVKGANLHIEARGLAAWYTVKQYTEGIDLQDHDKIIVTGMWPGANKWDLGFEVDHNSCA